jgi:two-component sensor histidine kinase
MAESSASVLVLTPEGRDAELAAAALRQAGIDPIIVTDLQSIIALLPGADCAVVAEEALLGSDRTALAQWISTQPPWSDFPFVLLTFRNGAADPRLLELLGNVTVLERPFHPSVLVSVARSATRARRRQREAELYLEERRLAEEHKELLIRELHHRVKNTLATVLALLRTGSRGTETISDFKRTFSDRILSMSQTHNLLVDGGWRAASLRDVLWNELGPFQDQKSRDQRARRIVLNGPPVHLPPELALPMGMVVHELATNAAKYGSLSVPNGELEVVWKVQSNGHGRELNLIWTEREGPLICKPSRTGFGSNLIDRILRRQCRAEFSVDFASSGLVFRLDLPLASALPEQGGDADPIEVQSASCDQTGSLPFGSHI